MQLKTIGNKAALMKQIDLALGDESAIGEDAVKFLKIVCDIRRVYLLGGAIRSVHHNEQIRDVDILLDRPISHEKKFMQYLPYKIQRNRLGGFKCKFTKVQVDLWTIESNWAYKLRLIKRGSISAKEIAKGSFYNFDSLVYALNDKYLECTYYNKCVRSMLLDIVKHSTRYIATNPIRAGNILRAIYLRRKYKLKFSYFLEKYIQDQLNYIRLADKNVGDFFVRVLNTYPKYRDCLNNIVVRREIDELIRKPTRATIELDTGDRFL
jgi:hypothetical protein